MKEDHQLQFSGLESEIKHHRECGEHEVRAFWERLGGKPDLRGKQVLDVGCGLGALCVDTATSGASSVIGIDVVASHISYATSQLQQFQAARHSTRYIHGDIRSLPPDLSFDVIMSKDAFEHIAELGGVLLEIERRLKPGGKAYIGFGPLYRSPFGDHGLTFMPWGHLLLPRSVLLRLASRHQRRPIRTLQDYGLNGLRYRDYLHLVEHSALETRFLKVNQSTHPAARILSWLRLVPGLADLCTFNMYCILEKTSSHGTQASRAGP